MANPRPSFDPSRIKVPEEPSAEPRIMSVSQLNAMIKRVLADRLPKTVHLLGEISNFSRPVSGHLYFTLKDENSEIRAVMWRSAASRLKFKPTDGLQVIATGNIDVYEPRGQYQLSIRKLEPRGTGALELAFRQLRDRLATEGLFDPKHKQPLPRFPRRIAVVTSPTGAAIRDILKTLQRRFPCASVMLHPVRVQGEGAAQEIAQAIRRLNSQAQNLGGLDVMIVGRGGGSLEDLWAFNEEIVARAVHDSKIPIISAVGHEVDVTIADLVADLRAPTPTAAAELAVPVLDELLELLSEHGLRLTRAVRYQIDLSRSRLDVICRFEWFRDPMAAVQGKEQVVDEISSRMQLCGTQLITRMHQRLHQLEVALATIQPAVFMRRQLNRLTDISHRLRWVMQRRAQRYERRLGAVHQAFAEASPQQRLQVDSEKVRQQSRHLDRSMTHRLRSTEQLLQALQARVEATSYRKTLTRGFTITRKGKKIITHPRQIKAGDKIATETTNGEFESQVTDTD